MHPNVAYFSHLLHVRFDVVMVLLGQVLDCPQSTERLQIHHPSLSLRLRHLYSVL